MITLEPARLENYFVVRNNGNYLCDVTTDILEDMRSWATDCEWGEDIWEDGFDAWKLSDLEIVRGIENHFGGGIQEFVRTYIVT